MSGEHRARSYAVWAIPDADGERALRAAADAAGARAFPPHVTVLRPSGALARDPARLAALVRRALGCGSGDGNGHTGAQGAPAPELVLLAPQAADAPLSEADTQAVLCPVDPGSAGARALAAVRAALAAALAAANGGDEPPPFAPHLTLRYGALPAAQRAAAAAAASAAGPWPRAVALAGLAVAAADGEPGTWRVVARIPLP